MSLSQTVSVGCPRCAHESEHELWESVNFDIDPDARIKLLEGSLNRFMCPVCMYQTMLDAPILCHDMKRQFMLYYTPINDDMTPPDPKSMWDQLPFAQLKRSMDDYRFRRVYHFDHLQEKVFLLTLGFDDRLVECFKATVERKLNKGKVPLGARIIIARFMPPAPAEKYESVVLQWITDTDVGEAVYPYQTMETVSYNTRLLADAYDENDQSAGWRVVDLFYGRHVCFGESL